MVAVVTEGRSGSDPNQIDYPDINSCITITAEKGQALVGAHFVVPFGSPPERAPALVWQKLKAELQLVRIGTVGTVYVLGSLDSWLQPQLPYHWPADFKRDLQALFGPAARCLKWNSQLDDQGRQIEETRLIRLNRANDGKTTISYGKYQGGKVVGPMHTLAAAALQPFPLA